MLFAHCKEVIVLTEQLKHKPLRNNEQTETSLNFLVGNFFYCLGTSKGYGYYFCSGIVSGVTRFWRQ